LCSSFAFFALKLFLHLLEDPDHPLAVLIERIIAHVEEEGLRERVPCFAPGATQGCGG
jgi:hypothetical protein